MDCTGTRGTIEEGQYRIIGSCKRDMEEHLSCQGGRNAMLWIEAHLVPIISFSHFRNYRHLTSPHLTLNTYRSPRFPTHIAFSTSTSTTRLWCSCWPWWRVTPCRWWSAAASAHNWLWHPVHCHYLIRDTAHPLATIPNNPIMGRWR